jgi:molybdopterin-biosynthesis enzyme MoeA-like protein
MLDSIAPTLKGGAAMMSETIEAAGVPEGSYAGELGAIAKERPSVSIGSYPAMTPEGFRNRIVVRSRDAQALAEARSAVEALVARLTA